MKSINSEIRRIKESISKLNNSENVDFLLKKVEDLEFIINNEELLKLRGMSYVLQSIETIKQYLKIK